MAAPHLQFVSGVRGGPIDHDSYASTGHSGNGRVGLSGGDKDVLFRLIVRNVPVETRKTLIHMALNKSHAAYVQFS